MELHSQDKKTKTFAPQISEASPGILKLNKNNFTSLVLKKSEPVVVEFMSYGCDYCRQLEPVIQQVATMMRSTETIYQVNVAVEHELADRYDITATPTLLMFLNGKIVGKAEGPSPTVSAVMTAITHPFKVRE